MNIIDFTDCNGNCTGCGQCCTTMIPMSYSEIATIRKFIKKHSIKEQRHNFVAKIDLTCPFRDDVNKICTIYKVRPAICREFKCNMSHENIAAIKMKYGEKYKTIFSRHEFFGNDEDIEFVVNAKKEIKNLKSI